MNRFVVLRITASFTAFAWAAAPARAQSFSGVVWAEADSGKIVRASGATIYVWPDRREIMSVIDSACTASTTDMGSWVAARYALNSADSANPRSPAVARDVALLRAMTQLPHITAVADSTGNFAISSIPYGNYWVEAETVMDGGIVQWWKPAELLSLPIRGMNSGSLGDMKMGPVELHKSQFCTAPEARVGAAAFATDNPISSTDRPYVPGEVDSPVRVKFAGEPPRYPKSMLASRISGQVILSFVVDTQGMVDLNSIRVTYSTAQEFIYAAETALGTMTFVPAQARGKPVRSRVEQTFNFSIGP